MRLLQSHCNRERATSHLEKLGAQAASERILRPRTTTPVRKGPKRLSAELNALIVADYQAGMRGAAIARKHGLNEWTVRHRLRQSGIPLRSTSMNAEQIALTQELRAVGMSYERIAQRVGFSEATVRNVLKRASADARGANHQ